MDDAEPYFAKATVSFSICVIVHFSSPGLGSAGELSSLDKFRGRIWIATLLSAYW